MRNRCRRVVFFDQCSQQTFKQRFFFTLRNRDTAPSTLLDRTLEASRFACFRFRTRAPLCIGLVRRDLLICCHGNPLLDLLKPNLSQFLVLKKLDGDRSFAISKRNQLTVERPQ